MQITRFKAVLLLAILLPLVSAVLGYFLTGMGQHSTSQTVSSAISQAGDSGEPVLVQKPDGTSGVVSESQLGFRELIIYLALLCGTIALLYHYLNTIQAWVAVILLPLGFSLLYLDKVGMSLTLFYVPNLVLAALLALMVKYLFFNRSVMRFRMIVCSILGAGLLTLYFRSLYALTHTPFIADQWTGFFMTGLILFVFVTFGMSVADMAILRNLMKTNKPGPDKSGDEDEDA
jgi:hypothetical protein